MRPWRDVISVAAWEMVVKKTDSTAHVGALTSLASRFDSQVETPKRVLQHITHLLRGYHHLQKDSLDSIAERVRALGEISSTASHYLTKFKVDMGRAQQRAQMKPSAPGVRDHVIMPELKVNKWDRSPDTGHFMTGNPGRETLDRNILTLARRALRKAAYLKRLQLHYTQEMSSKPLALIQYIKGPKENMGGLVGLAPGVRLEAIDPYHRPVELHMKNGEFADDTGLHDDYSMSAAFGQWVRGQGSSHSAPFFVWLENHPICLEDDKETVSATASVHYGNAEEGVVPAIGKVMLVQVGNPCMGIDLSSRAAADVCHTGNYMSAERKGGPGTAAYIWTEKRELYLGQHAEGAFHHSSFISGRQVRCAGMIKVHHGHVTFISNNSGHYKPGKANLKEFGQWLKQHGAMRSTAKVLCLGGKDFDGDYSGFCKGYEAI